MFFLHLKRNNDKETDVIAAKVAMVDLVVELNLPLSTLVRVSKVFKKSLRIQTLLKGQLKMFLFLVLSSSFLCLLFFFFVIRGRHVWCREFSLYCTWAFTSHELKGKKQETCPLPPRYLPTVPVAYVLGHLPHPQR